MEIVSNLKAVLKQIEGLEARYGRKIYLVGATKTRTAEEINLAVANGLKIVGENKPQEFRDKHLLINPDAEQHFIGHLQANKVKYVVGKASLIHSCDSLSLAEEISRRAKALNVVQDVLIEVNISAEENKHGFAPSSLSDTVDKLKSIDNLCFRGVMTVLPNVSSDLLPPYCKKMQEIFSSLKGAFGEQFDLLSMGMSNDYLVALEYGANMIRLGRAIFGERDYGVQNGKN